MNIKNDKNAVTLTVLVITIVVMLILFSITFSTSTELLKNSQRNKMKSMLYMVQSRARILLEDYRFNYLNEDDEIISGANDELLAGSTYSTSEPGKFGFEEKTGKIYKYRSWGEETLKSQGVDTEKLARGDTVLVQYNITDNEVDVASQKGFSKDGTPLHSLSDFGKK